MKAILLAASIGWQTQYDDKGRPKGRFVGVSVSWMPYEMSYKRCGYNHHITEEFAERMRNDPRLIEMQVDAVVRCFVNGAARLMEQKMSEVSDLTEACDELRRGLPDGFRAFFENENVWIHHFCHVLNVPKGSRYRASDGEWYEAEEDMMIAEAADIKRSWDISCDAMVRDAGDVVRDLLNGKEKWDVTIGQEVGKLPRKMKKAVAEEKSEKGGER